MKFTIVNSSPLSVAVVNPANDIFWNWGRGIWETTFSSGTHLLPMRPMEASPSLFASVLFAETGDALTEYLDVVLLVCNVDSSGNLVSVLDSWTPPSSGAKEFVGGGFSR